MKNISSSLTFFIQLAKIQAIASRRFDSRLGGLGFNEFMILYTLSLAEGQTMRRIDLAEKIGLTASGVTRILLPMEKVGLVSKKVNEHDARVSLVMLSPAGKQKLAEGIERAEIFCEEVINADQVKKIESLTEVLIDLGRMA